jgi:hypothetical protein
MQIEYGQDDERALVITIPREEIRVFRAAMERAMFTDIPPDLQPAALDLLQQLVHELSD